MRGFSLSLVAIGLLLGACAQQQVAEGVVADELPAGAAREILIQQCLRCHELEALTLFSRFYNRERWRSLVLTMRDNGAEVDDAQVEILAAYLSQHFGTGD